MSTTARCETCRFFRDRQCRRYPPTAWVEGLAVFPAVTAGDWCGEWAAADPPVQQQPKATPTDPRYAALSAALKATGWTWEQCIAWLSQAYPQEPRYNAAARFSDLEPARVDHLTRHLNTLAAQKGA